MDEFLHTYFPINLARISVKPGSLFLLAKYVYEKLLKGDIAGKEYLKLQVKNTSFFHTCFCYILQEQINYLVST